MSKLANTSGIQFDTNNKKDISRKGSIEIEDGTVIELVETVGVGNPILSKINSVFRHVGTLARKYNVGAISGTSPYGSRYYHCTYTIRSLLSGKAVCSLYTYYDVTRWEGITATSTSTAGCSTSYAFSMTKSSKIITKRAPSVGQHIRGQGDYHVIYNVHCDKLGFGKLKAILWRIV